MRGKFIISGTKITPNTGCPECGQPDTLQSSLDEALDALEELLVRHEIAISSPSVIQCQFRDKLQEITNTRTILTQHRRLKDD